MGRWEKNYKKQVKNLELMFDSQTKVDYKNYTYFAKSRMQQKNHFFYTIPDNKNYFHSVYK